MYTTITRLSRPLASPSHVDMRRRFLSVYAIGEGWTGALGTGLLDSSALGHDDEEEVDPPLLMFDGTATSIAAGWGHTAIIASHEEKSQLMVCGRPHDFQALLRLKRLPAFVRRRAVQHSVRYHYDVNDPTGHPVPGPTMAGRILHWMAGEEQDGPDGPWEAARRNSILPALLPIDLPNNDVPSTSSDRVLDASAGLTAVIGESGRLYTFGINYHGQCGVGDLSNNVWTPQQVMGLSTEFATHGRHKLEQQHAIVSVALGLQHGLALDEQGNLFTWGKGERGQLGQGASQEKVTSPFALRIKRFRLPSQDGRQRWLEDAKITKIAAAMNHSAALTDSNQVFVWGKNVEPPTPDSQNKTVVDSPAPIMVRGLPEGLVVVDVACGSHHTAMLMEDGSVFAVGITSDNAQPRFEAIELIPPGVVDMPCGRFDAHFDRTTIVSKDGKQVLQVHLWDDEQLQEYAVFTPPWVEHVIQDGKRIRQVDRGWLHTVVSTY